MPGVRALALVALLPGSPPLPCQAPSAIEMLDELVAPGTTPARRGDLHDRLRDARLSTFGGRLVRLLQRHRPLSGIGPSTRTPWREAGLSEPDRIAATLTSVWRAHVGSMDLRSAVDVVEILEDGEVGEARLIALQPLLAFGSAAGAAGSDATEFARRAMPRLERLAQTDTSNRLRSGLVWMLTGWSDPRCYFELAIQIARSGTNPAEECELLRRTGMLSHLGRLPAAARRPCLAYGFGLLRRLGDDAEHLRFVLATEIGDGLGIAPSAAGAPPFGPEVGNAARRSTPEYRRATVDRALSWYARCARGPIHEASPARPFVAAHTVFSPALHGASTLVCESRWHSHASLALSAAGELALGAPELSPLIPIATPVVVGSRWQVRGPALGALARRLSDLEWRDELGDLTTWRAWTGSGQYQRRLVVDGLLDARLEQRDAAVGIAAEGDLVVSDRARVGDRFGPNHKQTKATHALAIWLPLDAQGRVIGVELRDAVEIEGSYGTAGRDEPFEQRSAFETAAVESPTPAVDRQIDELLDRFRRSKPPGDGAVASELLALGAVIRPRIVAAICAAPGFAEKSRLRELLRELR